MGSPWPTQIRVGISTIGLVDSFRLIYNAVPSGSPTCRCDLPLIVWFQSLVTRLSAWTRRGRRAAVVEEVDTELRDAFLTELTDILQSIDSALARWRINPSDLDAHKQLRRGFHTIKGSAPLVGADLLGTYCKDLERLMNEFQERPAKITPISISTLAQAISLLPAFGESLRADRPAPVLASAVHQRVLRLIGR